MSKAFGSRLRHLRQMAGLLQQDMAKKLGISNSAYGFYEQGKREPSFEMTEYLADFFGVTLDYLMGRKDVPSTDGDVFYSSESENLVAVPILGSIKAGPDMYLEETHAGVIMTERSALNSSPHFWLSVKGDSMTGFSIYDGDFVLIRKEQPESSGKICAVAIDGTEVTLKRVKFEPEGMILESGNPAYPPRFFDSSRILGGEVQIIGIAKQIRRELE